MIAHLSPHLHVHLLDLLVVTLMAVAIIIARPRRRIVSAQRRAALREYLHVLSKKNNKQKGK